MVTSLTVSPVTPDIIYSAQVQFNVDNYNSRKNLGYATFIRSPTFIVGGYEWTLHYFPDGISEETEGHVSVALELMSENECAWTLIGLTFAGEADRSAWAGWKTAAQFDNVNRFLFHWPEVRSENLEQRGLVRNDCLEIQCHISVLRPNQLLKAGLLPEIEVPTSDLGANIGKLLGDQVTADVTFKVEKETFRAHRILLAAQSSVFDRQLFGQMKEKDMGCIEVHDMQPAVFRALLHFIYTDSMLDMSGMDVHDQIELIRHLLVAADRYCVERLKNICEGILCKCLDMESLLITFALADQHQCSKLLVACMEFLKHSVKGDIIASQWYKVLKDNHPDVAEEICKALKESHKIN
ncbi:BTB/POZ and MATH domain-containing protein 2-like [Phragmites australis]|uniref:BTB/POZ and MATH domain-containing protein 2-like n=1 Tax=Phragmites australis TaxID=29695 RepID=UPI002D77D6D5|nr:BTB/POZ and MATH domain-containing protein 2-like [Phragmites australis]